MLLMKRFIDLESRLFPWFCFIISKYELDKTKHTMIWIESQSQWVIVLYQISNFSATSLRKQVTFRWDNDNVCLYKTNMLRFL